MHKLTCGDKAGISHPLNNQYPQRTEENPFHPRPVSSSVPPARDPPPPDPDLNDFLNRNFLHTMPENEAFTFLIDSFRLRQEDEYQMTGDVECDSVYDGAETSLPGFLNFLDLAQTRVGVLPAWWNNAKRAACVRLGCKRSGWEYLGRAIESGDVLERYGSIVAALNLRVLAEKIYKRGVADDIFDSGEYGKAPWEE